MKTNIDPSLLVRRLVEARKDRGMSQEKAAEEFECSRLTLRAIEKGERPLKPEEIAKFAQMYGRSVHELVRPGSEGGVVSIPAEFHEEVEKKGISPDEYEKAHASCQKFLEDYDELEITNEAALRINFPSRISFSRLRHAESYAETIASQERNRLGLGDQPVEDLRNLLEWEVGLRSFYGDLPPSMAGIVFFNEDMGGVVVANQTQSLEQCLWTLVYCYGHLICNRRIPRIAYTKQEGNRSVEERFAESFANEFLLPVSGVRRRFYSTIESSNEFELFDLFRMARLFHVPTIRLTQRLVELRLVDKEILNRIELKPNKAQQVPLGMERFSERYTSLAVRAYHGEKISIGQLVKFLRTDIVEARSIVQDITKINDDTQFKDASKQSSPFASIVR